VTTILLAGAISMVIALLGNRPVITVLRKIQVGSYKLTRKRVFRMAPLQHHFELAGWAETTIVLRFWLIAGMFVALGLWVFCRGGVAGVRGF
jgi:phospho-N-acetylmuramoyl-pentapeptide-transferase